MDVNPEPVAATSRKPPSTPCRSPRNCTLVASVQAHLSQPTPSRNKHHAGATVWKNDVPPQYLPHPLGHRDACDESGSGDGTPVFCSCRTFLPMRRPLRRLLILISSGVQMGRCLSEKNVRWR
ncbi:hypothetical protein BDR06DRAFT_960552 [Suillus hirtellus]|nr:hypothetical protein BDR06DRAFT_960552 [Suillus hirtellus]